MISLRHLRICFQNISSLIGREQFENLQPIVKLRYSVKIEDKPKRPENSFLLFCKKFRPLVREKYPDADHQEVADRLATMWLMADKEQKLELINKSRQDFDEYGDRIAEFREQLSNVQKEELALRRRNKVKRRMHRARSDFLLQFNKPRRPQSPFLLFVDFKMERDQLSDPRKDHLPKLAADWKNLSVHAKSIFLREYKKLYKEYEVQMSKWENDMVKIGRSDLLPDSKRIDFLPNEKYILKMLEMNKDAKVSSSDAADKRTSSTIDETGSLKNTDHQESH